MDDFERIVSAIPCDEVPVITEALDLGAYTFTRYVQGDEPVWVTTVKANA